jgi:transposase-like protein
MAVEVNRQTKELREQILKEVKETGNMALVARNRGIFYTTIVSWVRSMMYASLVGVPVDSFPF